MRTIDTDAVILKIDAAASVVDLILTLKGTGDIESLTQHTLYNSLHAALDLLGEARTALEGVAT